MKASKAKEKAKVRVCVCVCVLFEEFGPVEGSTGVNASRTRVHDLWGKVAEWRRRGRGEEGRGKSRSMQVVVIRATRYLPDGFE